METELNLASVVLLQTLKLAAGFSRRPTKLTTFVTLPVPEQIQANTT